MINLSFATTIGYKIPKQIWNSRLVHYFVFKFFECPMYVYVLQMKKSKLELIVIKYIFLRYQKNAKKYRLLDLNAYKKIVKKM